MLHPKPKDVEKRKVSGFGKQSAQRMRVRSLSDFRFPSLADLKLQTFFFHRSLIGFFAKKKKKNGKENLSLCSVTLFKHKGVLSFSLPSHLLHMGSCNPSAAARLLNSRLSASLLPSLAPPPLRRGEGVLLAAPHATGGGAKKASSLAAKAAADAAAAEGDGDTPPPLEAARRRPPFWREGAKREGPPREEE